MAMCFLIHRGDRADEAGVADIHPRIALVRLEHHHHRALLQAHAAHVIQDAPVIQSAIRRGLAKDREAAAMEHLGEEVRQPHFLTRQLGGAGQRVHLADSNARP